MAREIGTHEKMIVKLFASRFGVSPNRYRMQLRVSHGIRMLMSTDTKVEAIALSVGFRSKASFYRMIKRITGKRPTELRAEG